MTRDILIRVWNTKTKEMSAGMPLPMLAGYLTAIHPNLGNEIYMEWMGKYDREGKPMFEGDITQVDYVTPMGVIKIVGVIVFNKRIAQFGTEAFKPVESMPDYIEEMKPPLVIGNIYQNPELCSQ